MLSICRRHHQDLVQSSPSQLKCLCQSLIDNGQQAYECNQHQRANKLLEAALTVARFSSTKADTRPFADEFLQMEYIACQHLANCLSACGKEGKSVLLRMSIHKKLLDTCASCTASRLEKMGALGVLDSSLMALTSQLSQLSRFEDIFEAIEKTEEIADKTAKFLWH